MSAIWAVVPAAGVGRRMGGGVPKQYLPLGGRTVIEHTLSVLVEHPQIAGLWVALGAEDGYWPATGFAAHPAVTRVTGGAERVHSVRNALAAMADRADVNDWVLVHDAARPCLRRADLDRLLDALRDHPVGGLLGVPVRDTMKRADARGAVEATLSREGLWHAFTPQMFRYGLLIDAIDRALADGVVVTDEASAVEHLGLRPLMVEGHTDNIKVTHPLDLPLAEFYLAHRPAEPAPTTPKGE